MSLLKRLIGIIAGISLLGSSVYGSSGAVSPKAYILTEVAGFPITNSMVMTWTVSIILVIVIRLAIGGRPKLIPGKGQAIVEGLVETVEGLISPIVGKRLVVHTFPLLVSLFIYILIQNWAGLIPGVGTIGRIEDGHLLYFFRPATSDINTTIALAIISMGCWLYFVLRYAGVKTFLFDLFGNKANKNEVPSVLYYILFILFFGVGFIEVVSILVRPLSLSLRLFGNIFGGENLLTSMSSLVQWVVPVPFYFLEVLIGVVQALIFVLLVAVYIGSICNHEAGHEEEGHHH